MRVLASLLLSVACLTAQSRSPLRFEISWEKPLDGHVVLIISSNPQGEPRNQISEGLSTQQMFGADVDGARSVTIDGATLGYPRESLDRVPAGEYTVQAVLNIYETFHRADGRTLKLPMDQGEGQHWNRKPGNLYSVPQKITVDPAKSSSIRIELNKTIPPIEPPKDSKYIKHVKIQSKLLSDFWGRPMYLGAVVLLPEGFDEHPDAHYPVMYRQGHFAATFNGFRTEPAAAGGRGGRGGGRGGIDYAYKLYQDWSSGRLPHMIIVTTQDANPFYDDSYAVNSANLGPYGDALVQELYPYVEKKFRGIGEPWARVLYGGSTGGWEALAQQVFNPDFYNGTWVACPDPIDFRAYSLVNLYEDKNAFYANSAWKQVPVPMQRETDGRITSVMEDAIRFELVLGTRGRSGEQFDIWQAVYSPVGEDGYPDLILDPRTGLIHRKVADYWKEHYDLDYIMQRDWKTLGPKLIGKLHFAVGDSDNFYLDRAVRLTEKFLESTKDPGKGPYYGGNFEYGAGAGHGYSGGPPGPESSGTLHQRLMPQMMEWMLKTAPPGADVKSWRY
ncbi:MAG TPA: alpha/beta hydrolase-fold protein [Bryobacteraceae bacterium]|nr:alpha/beta hydrolase-fold protein [Bryobacteraceae bacterium]